MAFFNGTTNIGGSHDNINRYNQHQGRKDGRGKGTLKRDRPEDKGGRARLRRVPSHTVRGAANTIIFYEKYRDKEALQAHSANLGKSLEKLLPLLEPGMDVKTCFEILQ